MPELTSRTILIFDLLTDLSRFNNSRFMRKLSARTQAATFIAITFLISYCLEWRIISQGGFEQNRHLVIYLMWTPGVVGIMSALVFGNGLNDIGLKRFTLKQLAFAYAVPALGAVLASGLLLLAGQSSIEIAPEVLKKHTDRPAAAFFLLVIAPTVGAVFASFRALGEEIGWRGFLHSKLRDSGTSNPHLITGLLWWVWHVPLILWAGYASSSTPWLSALLFGLVVVSFSYILGWQRDITGSVLLAAISHGAHNVWV